MKISQKINWHKVNRLTSAPLVIIIQLLFLFVIFKENANSKSISITIITLSLLLIVTHIKRPLHHDDYLYEHILVAIWIPIGAISAYYINNHLKLGPILAAGIVGLTGSIFPEINKRSAYFRQLPPAIYCGAFIGMSSPSIAHGFVFVFAAGMFAAIGFMLSKSLFNGMGGKLGLIAFIGVVITSFFLTVLSNYGY